MGLSAAEKLEMASLEAELEPKKKSRLTPEEEMEMKSLEAEVGSQGPSESDQLMSYLKDPVHNKDPRQAQLSEVNRAMMDVAPLAGMAAGGAGGLVLASRLAPASRVLPMAAEVVGSGAGGAAGEAAKYAGEKFGLKDDMTQESLPQRMTASGLAGAGGAMLGNLARLGGESLANSGVRDISKTLSRPGAPQIASAATQLNVKPTKGMMSDDYMVRNLEDSLGQSPSYPGSWIRAEQEPVRKGIQGAAEGSVESRSGLSDYEAGKAMQSGVQENLKKRLESISKDYQAIEAQTKGIDVDQKGLKRIAKNIRNLDEAKFAGDDGNRLANQFADWLEGSVKNVNDIKVLRTKALRIAQDQGASAESKHVASIIVGKLDQAQKNTVMRQAVTKARETPIFAEEGAFPSKAAASDAVSVAEVEGAESGQKLIKSLKDANRRYRELMQDLQEFGKGSGLTKGKRGMTSAVNDIENARPEEMAKALFDQNDVGFLKFMKEKMPEQFELARQQRLAQIVQQTGGKTTNIIKLADKMSPEAKLFLFGEENVKNLDAATTLHKSIPPKVGASDTPRGEMFKWHEMLNPMTNVGDLAKYGLLKGKAALPKLGRGLMSLQPAVKYGSGGLMMPGKKKGLVDGED